MTLKNYRRLLILSLFLPLQVVAAEAVDVQLSIFQRDPVVGRDVMLQSDTVTLVKGIEATGFITGLSLDLEVAEIDTASVSLIVHVHTFAPQPGNYARRFRVEYGLPARIDGMAGKGGAEYALVLVPLARTQVDTSACRFSHRSSEDFGVDATAHLNIYYVPASLGDYYWNSVKGIMEDGYEAISRMISLTMPGKYLLYLCPCRLNTVIWDDRFGMMVDPLRGTLFAIYDRNFNSAYPFVVSQAALFRNYGYAPPFLSEGFANYTSLALLEMRGLAAEGKVPPLDTLLDSYRYLQSDPVTSDRVSATFVKYLIDRYLIGRFLDLYKSADDLNLRSQLESVYGKPLGELEAEWRQYIDTAKVTFAQAEHHTVLAETMLDYSSMLTYAHEMLRLAASRRDSLSAWSQVTRACFFKGEYYAAIEAQDRRLALDQNDAREWLKQAGYRMISGEYARAASDLERAAALDSTGPLVRFNQALCRLYQGDTAAARATLNAVITAGGYSPEVESRVMLGTLLASSKDERDHAEALTQFRAVAEALSRVDRRHNPSPGQSMWLGMAYLGLGDTGAAHDYLQTALFLETRPFYQGMIELWLGKTADARGERSVAREHYQRVIAGASAVYHQDEARALLETPFRP